MLGGYIVQIGDGALAPINAWLTKAGVKPFAMNVAELATAAACGICFARRQILPSILLLIIHGMFDYLDGGVHRSIQKSGKRIHSRKFAHTATDKLSDVLLFLSLGWGRLIP
jgi:hypothetical protein